MSYTIEVISYLDFTWWWWWNGLVRDSESTNHQSQSPTAEEIEVVTIPHNDNPAQDETPVRPRKKVQGSNKKKSLNHLRTTMTKLQVLLFSHTRRLESPQKKLTITWRLTQRLLKSQARRPESPRKKVMMTRILRLLKSLKKVLKKKLVSEKM